MRTASHPLPIVSLLVLALFMSVACGSESAPLMLAADPHHTPVGFFDVHVCNWPDRAPFYMALLSGTHFAQIAEVRVYDASGQALGTLDLQRYRVTKAPGQPEKRAFITHFAIPAEARDGWFTAVIRTHDGHEYVAKDFVVHALLPSARELIPSGRSEQAAIPTELRWAAVPGATHYMVTIRDEWQDDAILYTSAMLTEPRLVLPAGLLQRGGSYEWVVHARDVNGSALLGDFNHGSLSTVARFSIAP